MKKNIIVISCISALIVFLASCDTRPTWESFSSCVYLYDSSKDDANIHGDTDERVKGALSGISFTLRDSSQEDKVLKTCRHPLYHWAGISFVNDQSVPNEDSHWNCYYLDPDTFDAERQAQIDGNSKLFLRINDSSCSGYRADLKSDIDVPCKSQTDDELVWLDLKK